MKRFLSFLGFCLILFGQFSLVYTEAWSLVLGNNDDDLWRSIGPKRTRLTAAQPVGCRYIHVLDLLIGNICEPGMKSLRCNRWTMRAVAATDSDDHNRSMFRGDAH